MLPIPLAIALASLIGCEVPIDPGGTRDRVRGGVLRVGAVHHPPWVDVRGGADPVGEEPRLVGLLAEDLGARVDWSVGGESELMRDLERRRLDLVVGGIPEGTAWNHRVALTRPHARGGEEGVVLAAPPGENGWLLLLDRWITGRVEGGPGGERP